MLPRQETAGALNSVSFDNQEFIVQKPAAQGSAATAQQNKLTFKEMSPKQKFVFIGKLVVSVLSFGFIFPNNE